MGDSAPAHPNSLDALLQQIEQRGSTFAEKATLLSQIIEEIDTRLTNSEGKVPASVNNPMITVNFSRGPHDEWGIWFTDEHSKPGSSGKVLEPLIRASITRKAKAFPLILKLLRAIEARQLEADESVQRALDSYDDFRHGVEDLF